MSQTNQHFKRLHDFIVLQLPSGFPVKIGFTIITIKIILFNYGYYHKETDERGLSFTPSYQKSLYSTITTHLHVHPCIPYLSSTPSYQKSLCSTSWMLESPLATYSAWTNRYPVLQSPCKESPVVEAEEEEVVLRDPPPPPPTALCSLRTQHLPPRLHSTHRQPCKKLTIHLQLLIATAPWLMFPWILLPTLVDVSLCEYVCVFVCVSVCVCMRMYGYVCVFV